MHMGVSSALDFDFISFAKQWVVVHHQEIINLSFAVVIPRQSRGKKQFRLYFTCAFELCSGVLIDDQWCFLYLTLTMYQVEYCRF